MLLNVLYPESSWFFSQVNDEGEESEEDDREFDALSVEQQVPSIHDCL